MIRFTKIDAKSQQIPEWAPTKAGARISSYAVTARRRLVGFVFQDTDCVEVMEGDGIHYLRKFWRKVEGWRGLGLNGKRSELFETRRQAAMKIASDVAFRTPATALRCH